MTKIIAADFMYLIFLGNDDIIQKMVDKLNINNGKKKIKSSAFYIKTNLCIPCAEIVYTDKIQQILNNDAIRQIAHDRKNNAQISDDDVDAYKKYIILDESVETAQCLAYADMISVNDSSNDTDQYNDTMMIMVLNEFDTSHKLSFPILLLDDEEDPDKVIGKWLKENDIEDIIKVLTVRLVNIVGKCHEILVFTAFADD